MGGGLGGLLGGGGAITDSARALPGDFFFAHATQRTHVFDVADVH